MADIVKVGSKKKKRRKDSTMEDSNAMRKYKARKRRLKLVEGEGKLGVYLNKGGDRKPSDLRGLAKIKYKLLKENPYTVQSFKNMCEKYFKETSEKTKPVTVKSCGEVSVVNVPGMVPFTLEGLLLYLGISRNWWNKYEKDDEFIAYRKTAMMSMLRISDNVLSGGLTSKYNSNLSKFYLQNISDLREKVEGQLPSGVKSITFNIVSNRDELKRVGGSVEGEEGGGEEEEEDIDIESEEIESEEVE